MKAFAFTKRSMLTVGFIVALVVSAVTAGLYASTKADSGVRDCSSNAIMECGALSIAELKKKAKANKEGDLTAIYKHYGIDINAMSSSNTKSGTVTNKGEVIVGGKVVATNAYTIGRNARPQANKPITINGKKYHERTNTSNFGNRTLDAFVVFDQFGRFKYAILKECGNPAPATPTQKPATATCSNLTAKKLNRTTYSFTAKATAANGAKVTGYVFDFGDGTKKTTTSATIKHTYAKPGNYTAKVTVKTNIGNKTASNCATKVTVAKAPAATCDALSAKKLSRTVYSFTAKASAANGAKITGYTFDFGDGTKKDTTSTTINHAYAKPGNYTVTVTAKTSLGDKTSASCATKVTVAEAPAATCDGLSAKKLNRTTYNFTARATASNGATISSYTFDFGDGTVKTSSAASISHSYAKPGDYEVTVTATTSVGKKTSANCATKVTVEKEKTPDVSIDKLVDGLKHKSVAVNQEFDYELTVTNTGETNLTNVVVTDDAPEHVTFIRADKGEIKDNKWSYTIPSLKIGASETFTITSKVTKEVEGTIKNTACVDASEVPGNPDDCDDATVEVPPVPMTEVCEVATKKTITIKEDDFDSSKHSTDFNDCKTPETPTELPTTGLAGTLMQILGLSTLTASIIYYAASASRR